jgi:CPA2 family monovalent cation:H+ antiporter-2
VGILIAQDLAVIPMILIVSAIGGASTGEQNFIIGLIMPVILLMVTAFLVWTLVKRPPWLSRFSKITDRIRYAMEHDRQRPLTAIMFCFAAGAISGGLGFSAAYGAFIAGLILGNSRYGHSYERQVRPLFDILMMFFFLSMGMLIDFQYLIENIWTVLVVLFVVMFLKTVINIGILRMFSLSKRNSTFIGATLGQVGEFSFALAALGLSRGAIDGDVYKMVAIVVALSLIATPIWLHTMRRISALKRYTIRKRRRVAVKPV